MTAFLFSSTEAKSQSTEPAKNDIWYVWMDATIDHSNTRVISDVFVIDCCVKSPKYRKLVKQAEKWIRKNVDSGYSGNTPLKKIQDEQLAQEMVAKAKSDEKANPVDFEATCTK